MATYAQLRDKRIRLIQEFATPGDVPPGDWYDISAIIPTPTVGQYWDGSAFIDMPWPKTSKEKALELAATINKADLISGQPAAIGKAVACLLLLSGLKDE